MNWSNVGTVKAVSPCCGLYNMPLRERRWFDVRPLTAQRLADRSFCVRIPQRSDIRIVE